MVNFSTNAAILRLGNSTKAFLQLQESTAKATVLCTTRHQDQHTSTTCVRCAARDRGSIQQWLAEAKDNVNVYSVGYCSFASPFSSERAGELFIVALAFTLQTVYPIAIITSFFKREEQEMCPRRAGSMLRFLAVITSLLFSAVSSLFVQGKIQGLLFLYRFCPIRGRRVWLLLGLLGQLVGMITALLAQYFVFVSIDPLETEQLYMRILLVSLTMQFTLNLDIRLVSSFQKNHVKEVVDVIGEDHLILGGAGVTLTAAILDVSVTATQDEDDSQKDVMPHVTAMAVEEFRFWTNLLRGTVFCGMGVAFSIGVALCI